MTQAMLEHLEEEESKLVKESLEESDAATLSAQLKMPPDFEMCKTHAQACKMRNNSAPTKYKECPCCGKPVDSPFYPLCVNPLDFAEHGLGVSLYYPMLNEFLHMLIFVMILEGLYFGAYYFFFAIYLLNPIDAFEGLSGLAQTSIFRLGVNHVEGGYIMGAICVSLGFYVIWVTRAKLFRETSTVLRMNNRTPSHYTVMLTNVPTGKDLNEAQFLDELLVSHYNLKGLARATFAYDIDKYVKTQKELKKVQTKLGKIETYREKKSKALGKEPNERNLEEFDRELNKSFSCCSKLEPYSSLKAEKQQLTEYLENYTKSTSDYLKRAPVAFATLHFSNECFSLVKDNENYGGWISRLLGLSRLKYQGQCIYVERAPEPEDIFWENLHISGLSKFFRKLVILLLSICVFAGSFIGNFYVGRLKSTLSTHKEETSGFFSFLLSIAPMVLTLSINKIMKYLVPVLVNYERASTKTEHDRSIAFKLAVGIFLNSAVLPFLAPLIGSSELSIENLIVDLKLIDTIFLNWIALLFAPPLTELIHLRYLWHLFKKWRISLKGENSRLTQLEANEAFEPPQINFARKYGEQLAIILFTGFYCLLFPLGFILTILGISFRYWVDKVLMLRRYKKPVPLNHHIAVWTTNGAIGFVVAVIASQIVFCLVPLGDVDALYPRIDEATYWFRAFLPMGWFIMFMIAVKVLVKVFITDVKSSILFKMIFHDTTEETKFVEKFGQIPYSVIDFEKDYKYFNVITHQEARLEYVKAHVEEEQEKSKVLESVSPKAAASSGYTPSHYAPPSPTHSVNFPRPYSPPLRPSGVYHPPSYVIPVQRPQAPGYYAYSPRNRPVQGYYYYPPY
eukprot:TRINITY_DN105282_c0_g1_i1.p1 TRINITY_DN105282_c0_g1~~TRINITY_DN105282_c0_g1_i1.p1  ORF type:complete len:849 (-),score=56.94 TRINITY_DN105282_c0_g1_i1:74-2620(-)